MRKNIIHIGLILLLAPCYTACSSFLDELPDNRTELDTEQSIANILVSAYPQSTNCEIWLLAKGRRGLVQLERYLRRRTRYSTSLMGCLLCGNRLIQPCTARNQEPGKSDIVKSPERGSSGMPCLCSFYAGNYILPSI